MGVFHVDCIIENVRKPRNITGVKRLIVDSGAEYTWIPEDILETIGRQVAKKDIQFLMVNGQTITRDIGYAIIRVNEFKTVDEVVFGKKRDLKLLGARTLEGFAARVDSREKRLVAAGPIPAA